MRKEMDSKIYHCNGDKINRIEVCLMYNSDLKRYYISITRCTKKQDKLALDKFLHDADNLAEQMAKRFGAVLEV